MHYCCFAYGQSLSCEMLTIQAGITYRWQYQLLHRLVAIIQWERTKQRHTSEDWQILQLRRWSRRSKL